MTISATRKEPRPAEIYRRCGTEEDFDYKGDENDNVFDANFKLIRDRRAHIFKQQEEQKLDNLQRNRDPRKAPRTFDSQDTSTIRQLQDVATGVEAIGAVPAHKPKHFGQLSRVAGPLYDNQSIYFELKELDRAKISKLKSNCACAPKNWPTSNHQGRHTRASTNAPEFKHLGPCPRG